jgi:hypothetical protein
MLGALVAAGGVGLLLGLCFRVPAVIFASAGAAIVSVGVAQAIGASPWAVLLLPIGAVVALQCGYLGGLMLGLATSRALPWEGGARSEALHRRQTIWTRRPMAGSLAEPRHEPDRSAASREDCLAD